MAMAVSESGSTVGRYWGGLRRSWLPILVVTLLAIVAMTELRAPYVPLALWAGAVLAILAIGPGSVAKAPKRAVVQEIDEEQAVSESHISGVRSGLAVLDTPEI